MAAMSAAHAAPTYAPPSASSGYSWNISASGHTENQTEDSKYQHQPPSSGRDDPSNTASARIPLASQNGNSAAYGSNAGIATAEHMAASKLGNGDADTMRLRNPEASYMSPPYEKDSKPHGGKDSVSPVDSTEDLHGNEKNLRNDSSFKRSLNEIYGDSSGSEESKWIHRDKLARIESEELQAAGIVLPKPRARSKSQSRTRRERDPSHDRVNGHGKRGDGEHTTRSRKNSALTTTEPKESWGDLRTPEEIAEEAENSYWTAGGGAKISRIPVAKVSPAPIPSEHLERDTVMTRKREPSPGEDETISYPKTRARSGSTGTALSKTNGTSLPQPEAKRNGSSPKKAAAGAAASTAAAGGTATRKPSLPKPANGAAGRPKTRGGPSKDSTSSGGGTTRPTTRSGELGSPGLGSKPMEGDPPWMVSAYRPDPRLPPDQQLLPTVARRLQQEKWEREGKFGNVYDKEFRPLNDEGFLKPPEPGEKVNLEKEEEEKAEMETQAAADWPLKAETRSINMPSRTGSYSTMPKISDKANQSPLPSPRLPNPPAQVHPSAVIRVPEPPEEPQETEKKKGCGCCVVM